MRRSGRARKQPEYFKPSIGIREASDEEDREEEGEEEESKNRVAKKAPSAASKRASEIDCCKYEGPKSKLYGDFTFLNISNLFKLIAVM